MNDQENALSKFSIDQLESELVDRHLRYNVAVIRLAEKVRQIEARLDAIEKEKGAVDVPDV